MNEKRPIVSIDILCIKDGKILTGLLTEKWWPNGKPTWGFPGREINFGETISQTIERNMKEEFGESLKIKKYKIISINANYELGNHYIGIGIVADVEGEPELLLKNDWKRWEWFKPNLLPELFTPARNLLKSYLTGEITVSE